MSKDLRGTIDINIGRTLSPSAFKVLKKHPHGVKVIRYAACKGNKTRTLRVDRILRANEKGSMVLKDHRGKRRCVPLSAIFDLEVTEQLAGKMGF